MSCAGCCGCLAQAAQFWFIRGQDISFKSGCLVQGAVLCLAQAAQFLFSGGQDTTIKVWQFDATSQAFQPLVSMSYFCLRSAKHANDFTSQVVICNHADLTYEHLISQPLLCLAL